MLVVVKLIELTILGKG